MTMTCSECFGLSIREKMQNVIKFCPTCDHENKAMDTKKVNVFMRLSYFIIYKNTKHIGLILFMLLCLLWEKSIISTSFGPLCDLENKANITKCYPLQDTHRGYHIQKHQYMFLCTVSDI